MGLKLKNKSETKVGFDPYFLAPTFSPQNSYLTHFGSEDFSRVSTHEICRHEGQILLDFSFKMSIFPGKVGKPLNLSNKNLPSGACQSSFALLPICQSVAARPSYQLGRCRAECSQ